MGLMGIGEFARLSRLSPKALRLYDELGLLPPARVDVDSGYRWYAGGQLDLDASAAAGQVAAWWTGAQAQHAARRELASYLVDRLNGKRPVMHEIAVRDIPARSLLTLLRHVHPDKQIPVSKEFFMGRMRKRTVPSPDGIAGAPFMIYHAEVSDLTLRTEPAHQEAFIHLEQRQMAAQGSSAGDALYRWALEQHREPNGGIRMILIGPPSADAPGSRGPDFDRAFALR